MSSNQPNALSNLADEALVERFQATGEMMYFEEIWRRYSKKLYSKCLCFMRDASAAEDVAADVFLKAIASLRAQYRPHHFAGWLFTIGRHECINHVKQAAERLRGGNTDDLHLAAPGDPAIAADIRSVLSLLSAPQRIAIKLFYVSRYSYEEIATLEGWTLKEVKAHLQNGRRMFKLLWGRTGQGTAT
jgi:RNA polymerase sigma-70 factor (ECF subfamily)